MMKSPLGEIKNNLKNAFSAKEKLVFVEAYLGCEP